MSNSAMKYPSHAKTLLEVKHVVALADAARIYGKQVGARPPEITTIGYAPKTPFDGDRGIK